MVYFSGEYDLTDLASVRCNGFTGVMLNIGTLKGKVYSKV